MAALVHHLALALPLFSLVLVGYATMRLCRWPTSVADGLTRFVFSLALPAVLFRLMSKSGDLPPVDWRLLIAFFGGCLIVFVIARLASWKLFALDGVAQSVFALGCIFSNNLMLGLPLAKASLGDAAMPSVALILVFNALILWTLVTVSVEWAKSGSLSVRALAATARGVLTNPVVVGILSGALFGLSGWTLPEAIDSPLNMVGQAGTPLALIALGMGLAEYGIRAGWRVSVAVCAFKLVVLPLVVWGLARLLALPAMETRVIVLLSSMAIGANVYLMSRQFQSMEGATASSLVLSTVLAALTTPLALSLMDGVYRAG
jgi:predicted permease